MLKKIIRYISNKPLYGKYYRLLDPPTAKEKEDIKKLKKTFKELPYEFAENCPKSERLWKQNMNNLRELVLKNNPREFLRWDIILGTMFVGNEQYVLTELNDLRKKYDWKNRWEKAIQEVSVGNPIPFDKYHHSSPNLIHHAYHLSQFEEMTGISTDKIDCVFEFGGGYGSMCRLFHNLGFKGKYLIFDLPHFSALQTYYLKTIGIPVYEFDRIQASENGVVCVSDIGILKKMLSSYNGCRHSIFIATWSISEAPLNIRDSILPSVSHFRSFLIAYQDYFCEINNIKYFENFKNYFDKKIIWNQREIRHLPGNTYLVGTQNLH